mgnify:FL=1
MMWLFIKHRLFYVLALQTLASRPAFPPRTVALTIFFEAVAFLTFAFRNFFANSTQKQTLFVSACQTFTIRSTGQSQLETLTVIFLASGFGTETSSHWRLRVRTSRGRSVGSLELVGILSFLDVRMEEWSRLIVIVEGSLLSV